MSEPNAVPDNGTNPLKVLTRKVGPLPGWVWVALAVGGYVAYQWYRKRNAPTTIGTDTSTGTDSGTPSDSTGASSVDGGLGAGSIDTGVTSAPVTATPAGPRTNGDWARMAVAYLVTKGHTPIQASNAVSNYLGRKPLTDNQRQMINQAIRAIGSPPEGVVGATVQASKPANHNISYTTKQGDTLHHLASRFYGNPALWLHIRSHNDNLKKYGPDEKIKSGLHIVIPFFVEQPKAG